MTGINLGGADGFPFDTPGDSVEGFILEVVEIQAKDANTKEPVFWDKAKMQPRMLPAITLQTVLREDGQDDGQRIVYLGGNKWTAVKRVTRRVEVGGWLKITFTEFSDREPENRAFNRAKLYTAEYRAAPDGISLDPPPPAPAAKATGPVTSTVNLANLSEDKKIALRELGVDV